MLPVPRCGKGVGLPRFRGDRLRGQGTTVRTAWAHRHDVLSWRQVTIVRLTLCDGTYSRTIYRYSEDLSGSKFGASLDDQMGHRARRPCARRLASGECEVHQRKNEHATNRIFEVSHGADCFRSGSWQQVRKR